MSGKKKLSGMLSAVKDDPDVMQFVTMAINLVIQLFSAMMAALLSVFVPQLCCHDGYTDDYGTCRAVNASNEIIVNGTSMSITDGKICSMDDNFNWSSLSGFNRYVLVNNFVFLFIIIFLFVVEFRRETFLILHFDEDSSKIDNYVTEKVFGEGLQPDLKADLQRHNQLYHKTYSIATIFWLINGVVSAVLLFKYYYLDTRTATAYITNNLLIFTRFTKGYQVASTSLAKDQAVSYYAMKQVVFNILDKSKYRDFVMTTPHAGNSNGAAETGSV